jgi:hypothetical protein
MSLEKRLAKKRARLSSNVELNRFAVEKKGL